MDVVVGAGATAASPNSSSSSPSGPLPFREAPAPTPLLPRPPSSSPSSSCSILNWGTPARRAAQPRTGGQAVRAPPPLRCTCKCQQPFRRSSAKARTDVVGSCRVVPAVKRDDALRVERQRLHLERGRALLVLLLPLLLLLLLNALLLTPCSPLLSGAEGRLAGRGAGHRQHKGPAPRSAAPARM